MLYKTDIIANLLFTYKTHVEVYQIKKINTLIIKISISLYRDNGAFLFFSKFIIRIGNKLSFLGIVLQIEINTDLY